MDKIEYDNLVYEKEQVDIRNRAFMQTIVKQEKVIKKYMKLVEKIKNDIKELEKELEVKNEER